MHESDALWICAGLLRRPGGTSLGGGLVATRPQPKLLAQGKPRMLGGATRGLAGAALRPWLGHQQVPGLLPGSGRRGRAMEARAATGELRGRGAQDLRASGGRARHRVGDAGGRRRPGLPDDPDARRGVPRRQHRARQAAPDDGGARVPAQRPHPADDRRRAGDEVACRAQPSRDGEGQSRRSSPSAAARTSAASWPRCASSPGGWAGSTGQHRPAGRPRDRTSQHPARSDSAVRRPAPAPRDPSGARDGRLPPTSSAAPRAPTR